MSKANTILVPACNMQVMAWRHTAAGYKHTNYI